MVKTVTLITLIQRTASHYHAHNNTFNNHLAVTFEVGPQQQQKTPLDLWLTERYALFQDTPMGLHSFAIHHIPWPLQSLIIDQVAIHYPRFQKLIGNRPQKSHYSKGVQVLAWGKQKCTP